MSASEPIKDTESFRDSIATVDAQGKRVWIYPKKPKGKFTDYRTYVSWLLLAVLFGTPFIKVNGEPLMLFNVIERKFIIFGIYFGPQDLYLLALAMLTFIVFIALFTVIFGRLFCGWVCPQTIFMEMVYRKIEYWIEGDSNAQRRLNKAPWTTKKYFKKISKHLIFFSIAVLIANTFLSYIIGVEQVGKIITDPIQMHLGGFAAMLIFSGLFYGVFAFMREQVCIAVCPYGRLQSVLLDETSIVVAYDYVRGEPRGKIKRAAKAKVIPLAKPVSNPNPLEAIQKSVGSPVEKLPTQLGDCIDCNMCVKVCPTGIDIRNGTQLECVNCTACIDACDEIMEKVNRPLGLIRYDSEQGIQKGERKIFTMRVKAYTAVLVALFIFQGFLLVNRNNVEVLLMRTPGMLYQKVDETTTSNLYNYQISNKTSKISKIEFRVKGGEGKIRLVGKPPYTVKNGMTKGALFIDVADENLHGSTNELIIEVLSEGKVLDEVKTNFLAPDE